MSKQRWIVVILLIGLVSIAGLALIRVRSQNALLTSASEQIPGAATLAPQDRPRASDPVQNIRFTIYENGIAPRELKVNKGLVAITIEDRTRKSEGLAVEREAGARVGHVKRVQNFWRGRDQVRLTPGTYTVFDTSNPENRARLVVAP